VAEEVLPTRLIVSDEMSTGQIVVSIALVGIFGLFCYYSWSIMEAERQDRKKWWIESLIRQRKRFKQEYFDRNGVWCDWHVEWQNKTGEWIVAPKPGFAEAAKFMREIKDGGDYTDLNSISLINDNPLKLKIDPNDPSKIITTAKLQVVS
jgi:hypothetical protein